jgi:predicted enzyme related to lactoylglutathione lyase
MPDANSRGRFVWYDLMTTAPERAVAFYTKVAGWGTAAWEGPTPYTMWTNNSRPIGGVMPLPPSAGAQPHWLAYIASANIEATVKQTTDFGGRVLVPPTDIPTVGRYAVLTDPQGVAFAAFSGSSETPGHEGPPEPGEFSWRELATRDYPAAFRFYETLFGWNKSIVVDMGGGATYQIFGRNGVDLGGMFDKPPSMPGPPGWLYYIRVPDLARALDAVKASGGKVLSDPMEVPGGDTVAPCLDPQGAAFALHQKKGR